MVCFWAAHHEGTSYPNAYLCGAGPDFGSVSFLLIAILWNRADLVTETEGAGQKGVHLCMHLAISSATVGTAEVQWNEEWCLDPHLQARPWLDLLCYLHCLLLSSSKLSEVVSVNQSTVLMLPSPPLREPLQCLAHPSGSPVSCKW